MGREISKTSYELHFAPLQGHTDRIYRNTFEDYFGSVDAFYTPFIRVEHDGTFRNRDLRDIEPAENRVKNLIPQILPGSPEEFRLLCRLLVSKGYSRVDINLGCPFPMIAKKGKGAGMLADLGRVKTVLQTVEEFPELNFSLKMRLGWENVSEGLCVIDVLNHLRLCHITVHARLGKQQYKGVPDLEAFQKFYTVCKHPLFYNGDLKKSEEIGHILEKFPLLRGVSIGRGLLSSPMLNKEFHENVTFPLETRMSLFSGFHDALVSSYSEVLQGENQLLMRLKTLWEYFIPESDKKLLKRIRKANRLADYKTTVQDLFKLK